jgi:predicted ATPase/DNA-binding SARP family transcriptional activator
MVGDISVAHRYAVHLLGVFRAEHGMQPISLPTHKVKSLFAYLILHPGAHSREKLADLFWGDSSEAKAHGSLRKALTLLRQNLTSDIVLADRETVRLNPAISLWVDAFEFERQAHQFLKEPAPELSGVDFEVYQGDLLTELYDDWLLPAREHYRLLYVNALLQATELLRSRSEYKTAIEFAQQVLKNDATNERAHQHLMFCYTVTGEREHALQQYDTCRVILRDELGVQPAPETQALYNWIKQSVSGVPSLAARLTNLPIPISSFIGRGRELATIKQLVAKARLVTLTGAGGNGKTRLAIQSAMDLIDSFQDGVWWVELAPLTDPALVPAAVTKALGLNAQTDQPLLEALAHFLQTRQSLLILDNCEHLLDACAQLAEHLLLACPGLKILCTSRESLSLTGENIWRVPTLSLPEAERPSLAELLMQYEGIQLFVERAGAVKPDFNLNDENALAVARICQGLGGIPLAIELAASRVKTMAVDEIAAHLDDRLQLLTAENRTSQKRHQTLRAAIEWSYELLTQSERLLFSRLSVFSGGWTLDAAEAVCSGEGIERREIMNLLARLVDKSLVAHTDGQRYGMLETMRQYGNEKLAETGKQAWVIGQHLDFYLNMAGTGDEKIRGPEQLEWLKWFDAESANFVSAMNSAFSSAPTVEKGCELVCALCWYWGMVSDFAGMKYWLEIALVRSAELGGTPTRARVLFNAGSYSVWGLNWLTEVDAYEAVGESLELWRALGTEFLHEVGKCLFTLGWIQKVRFDNNEGYDNFHQGVKILKSTHQAWWLAWATNLYELMIMDHKSRPTLIDKEVAMWEKLGDQMGQAVAVFSLGTLALERGDFSEADVYLSKSLQIFNLFKAKGFILQVLMQLGDTARGLNRYDRAETDYQASIPMAQETMLDAWMPSAYCGLGYVALHRQDDHQAEEYFRLALKISRDLKMRNWAVFCVAGFAAVSAFRSQPVIAARLFGVFHTWIETLQAERQSKRKVVQPADQMEVDKYLALCKSQVDETVFEQAWNEGRGLSLEEALRNI